MVRFMIDKHSKEIRSFNMSQIRSKDTKPEILVRKYLFSKGFRYRKNVKYLPGTPDIVLPKYKTVIFVNGCFWHMHNCENFVMPKSNIDYWKRKLENNVLSDKKNYQKLKILGWSILTIWECELKKNKVNKTLISLENKIRSNI